MSIYIGAAKIEDYSAMRGPCPEGYHIPSNYEWNSLYSTLITSLGLAANRTTMRQYLKMPPAGYRRQSDGGVVSQGSRGDYRSCTVLSNAQASFMQFTSSSITPEVASNKGTGISIRGFKNSAVVPDSSWTTLYDGSSVAAGAGIYYNATLGLISISGDGKKWYTIQDKNLGATVVYNSGDTLSETNCGYYYQRGNNYGFAFTGTLTTSSTRVNASSYGPGNYYSSSTFITGSASWDTSNNPNLWGGQNRTPSQVKNVYIGYVWTPGANTYAYYPLTQDANDYSGNNRNLTAASAITYSESMGAYLPNSAHSGMLEPFNITTSGTRTFSRWQNTIGVYSSDARGIDIYWGASSRRLLTAWSSNIQKFWRGGSSTYQITTSTQNANTRYLNTITLNNGVLRVYVNGVYLGTGNVSTGYTSSYFRRGQEYNQGANRQLYGYLKDIIVEDKVWTDQEVSDYYDKTKGTYGIS